MFKLAVNQDFIAQHFLIGGDWGSENQKHSHHYRLEIELKGKDLDSHGYLLDIVKVKAELDRLVCCYRDHTLNELPEFKGLNPSIENLAHIAYLSLRRPMQEVGITLSSITVWEDDIAWVSYQED